MNLNDLKVTGKNIIHVTDSIATPLLGLKISLNEDTTIPDSNELIIYVDTSETPTENRKTYSFNLNEKLSKTNESSDELILEPVLLNKNIELKAYVKRISNEVEELEYQDILLFEGSN